MYVPSCSDITHHTQSYSQSQETGMWDTREPAQNILRSVLEAHGDKLAELPQKLEGGRGTLRDLCALGDNASDVRAASLLHCLTAAHAFPLASSCARGEGCVTVCQCC